MAKDIHYVSESTEDLEQDTQSFIKETKPLVIETLKDTDALTRSSQEMIDILQDLFGYWLKPADGHGDDLEKEDSITKEKIYSAVNLITGRM